MSEIKGRNVLVTGGASGLGKLIADRLLRHGAAKLAVWDIDEPALMRAAEFWRSHLRARPTSSISSPS